MVKIFMSILALCLLAIPAVSGADTFYLGVGTHIYRQDAGKDAESLQRAGANSMRDDVLWASVEKKAQQYAIPPVLKKYLGALEERKIVPLLVLAYGNPLYGKDGKAKPVSPEALQAFARYAGAVASQLKGRVGFYEIWNEWDSSGDPKSADAYLKLVKAAAPAIRSADPQAQILAGAATTAAMRKGWVTELVSSGVLNFADGISVHPYVHCERNATPEAWITLLRDFAKQLKSANGGGEVPLYLTEMGWPTHTGACGIPPTAAAKYLGRGLMLVRTVPSINGFWWYDLRNDGTDSTNREDNFGLLTYEYGEKPAYKAFSLLASLVIGGSSFVEVKGIEPLHAVAFTDAGRKYLAAWGVKPQAGTIVVKASDAVTVLNVESGRTETLVPVNGVVRVNLDDSVRILSSKAGLSVSGAAK